MGKHSAKHLSSAKADVYFPGLLSDDERDAISTLRGKKTKRITYEDYSETEAGILVPEQRSVTVPEGYGDQEFDILKYMKDAEDPITGTLRDLKIDDRDLKLAKNYHDFSFNIIGKDAHPPWARQMWTGLMLYGEVCPCCSNPKWLDIHNVPKNYPSKDMQEHLVLLEYGKCPKCKREKWELIQHHGLKNYQQLSNVLGQRSGKSSSTAGGYIPYLAHRYLKFPNLASMTNLMQASTELTCTFVSLTFGKAQGILWTPFKKLIEKSSWFKQYFEMLDFYGKKYGQELYQNNQLFLTFKHKNLRFYPSGPKSSTLRGDTRIAGVLDELGLFPLPKGDAEEDEQSERANADEAHKSLTNSLATVQAVSLALMQKGQSAVPPALMFCVSSPISERDKVMRLYRESKTAEGGQYILGINLPTWEVNPGLERNSPIIAMAFNSNYEKAMRDFGASPPRVHSTYIKKESVQEGVFVGGKNSHNLTYQYDSPGELYGKVQKVRTIDWPSVLTMDAGLVNNSFVLTGGHYNFDTGKTETTTIIEIMPHDGRRINFNLVYQHLILPIAKDINAVALIADQWQSIDILHRAKADMGKNPLNKDACLTKQFTPRRKHFDANQAMLLQKNLICPMITEQERQLVFERGVEDYRAEMIGHPVAHLALQIITVKDIGEGRCPDKGDGFTDDIFRSWTLLNSLIHEPAVMQRLVEARDFPKMGGRRSMPRPGFAGRSGGMMHRGLR